MSQLHYVWTCKPHAAIAPPHHPTYNLRKAVQDALDEDAGDRGDVTTQSSVPAGTQAEGTFLAKSQGVVAGLAVADLVFEMVDPSIQVEWLVKDGDRVEAGQKFGFVQGSAASILVAERIALNFMQRMSGTATATAALVTACQGTAARILDTRKTVPGLRLVDKWAHVIGGGCSHRMGLYDMMMIKDNHVTAAGGVTQAVQKAEQFINEKGLTGLCIEVETRTLEEVQEILQILKSGQAPHVTRVMLDNMTKLDPTSPGGVDVSVLSQAVKLINGCIDTEASGNVTINTVRAIAETGVTYISVGSVTHSVTALDISLKIRLV